MPVFKLGRFNLIRPYREGLAGNRAPRALFAYTLDESEEFLAKGYLLLMGKPNAWWGTFVGSNSLKITLEGDDV